MPNQNPSGPNQPLNQHPTPYADIYVLARDQALFTGLNQASGDVLVIPPPVEGGRRWVDTYSLIATTVGAGTDTADVEVVYKDGNGNEIVVNAVSVPAAGSQPIAPDVFILVPEDQGIFLRVTADPPAGSVSAAAKWRDVRNVDRVDVELTTVFQTLFGPADVGNILFCPKVGEEVEGGHAWYLNYDPALAPNVELRLTDGTNVFLFGATPSPADTATLVAQLAEFVQSSPELWVQARIDDATGQTEPVVVSVAISKTNQGPAREDQGGAY